MSDDEAKIICTELGYAWEGLAEERQTSGEPGKQDFRRAAAALERYRHESADRQKAHMASELYNLAHGGESS